MSQWGHRRPDGWRGCWTFWSGTVVSGPAAVAACSMGGRLCHCRRRRTFGMCTPLATSSAWSPLDEGRAAGRLPLSLSHWPQSSHWSPPSTLATSSARPGKWDLPTCEIAPAGCRRPGAMWSAQEMGGHHLARRRHCQAQFWTLRDGSAVLGQQAAMRLHSAVLGGHQPWAALMHRLEVDAAVGLQQLEWCQLVPSGVRCDSDWSIWLDHADDCAAEADWISWWGHVVECLEWLDHWLDRWLGRRLDQQLDQRLSIVDCRRTSWITTWLEMAGTLQ